MIICTFTGVKFQYQLHNLTVTGLTWERVLQVLVEMAVCCQAGIKVLHQPDTVSRKPRSGHRLAGHQRIEVQSKNSSQLASQRRERSSKAQLVSCHWINLTAHRFIHNVPVSSPRLEHMNQPLSVGKEVCEHSTDKNPYVYMRIISNRCVGSIFILQFCQDSSHLAYSLR